MSRRRWRLRRLDGGKYYGTRVEYDRDHGFNIWGAIRTGKPSVREIDFDPEPPLDSHYEDEGDWLVAVACAVALNAMEKE